MLVTDLDPAARPPADLDVGLIYTNERRFMPRLLSSLAAAAGRLTIRLILVDNHSDDGVEPWRHQFARTSVVHNLRRLPYGANLNRVLRLASAPFVLLMNTDMYFDDDEPCLEKMAAFMDREPTCGVSTCRIYHPDGGYAWPARRFQTPRTIAARRLGLAARFPRELSDYFYQQRDHFDSFDCDWVSGCWMFLRRRAIADVGPFDERFTKYFEDVDYCARLHEMGWRVMLHGATHCYHHEQRASRRLLSFDAVHHLRSYARWMLSQPRTKLAA
jgi:N-acetylglucosaminyl-diphospho-decaprenol L-rhamnosyltransferase